MESQQEGQEAADRAHRIRQAERASAQAAAPWAEELKKGAFTVELLKQATRIGFSQRIKVHIAWLGTTLRLEARERRLELRPTATGVVAVYLEGAVETHSEPLDLAGDPAALVRQWLEAPAA